MTWTLVILLLTGGEGATLSGAENLRFETEAACLKAGRQLAAELNQSETIRLRVSCIETLSPSHQGD